MPPIYVKGGVWTNVEDEILKVAIAKYGLNQWSRVSSLLTKKNAKQCKLRWQEWLDPRIKKSDWSPEEDKKLLNLSRLRPNQWSSIALLLNRTANQCIERYQELLTDRLQITADNESKDLLLTGNLENYGKTAGSTLGGGHNLNPESKPARPDLEEMDEDELEMISEAKSRLTNTQGKKAKRKAREKVLEETRRVAELLRRRELRQVGINAELKIKKKFKDQMNYSADIAFERRPEQGPFQTAQELEQNINYKNNFDKSTDLGGTFNQEVKAQKKKEKRRREQNKKLVSKSSIDTNKQFMDMDDSALYADEFLKRRKLTFDDDLGTDNIDGIVDSALKDIKDVKSGKSMVFSRKRVDEDSKDPEQEYEAIDGNETKKEKKRIKEERRRVVELLSKLPEPIDDYEIEVDDLVNGGTAELVTRYKDKPQIQVIIDKTEQRKLERERYTQLQMELNSMQTPDSVNKKLPVPVIPRNETPADEFQKEFIRLVQSGATTQTYMDVEELSATINLRKEIEKKIQEEAQRVALSGNYEEKIANCEFSMDSLSLLKFLKKNTEESTQIENKIDHLINEERKRLSIAELASKISEDIEKIDSADNEIWAYKQYNSMESQSIEIRKERIQKELDNVNLIISTSMQHQMTSEN